MSEPLSPSVPSPTPLATRIRNLVVVGVAIALSVTLFFSLRTGSNTASLSALAASATPLNVALSNHKPTVMEFYADWCTACQAMAQDVSTLKQDYGDRVNFVMLNVDNSKWLPEMLHYRVDGIPHFVFLDPAGEAIANTIGEQPRTVMAANLEALASNSPLPFTQAKGRISAVDTPTQPTGATDPRSHGGQVVSPTDG